MASSVVAVGSKSGLALARGDEDLRAMLSDVIRDDFNRVATFFDTPDPVQYETKGTVSFYYGFPVINSDLIVASDGVTSSDEWESDVKCARLAIVKCIKDAGLSDTGDIRATITKSSYVTKVADAEKSWCAFGIIFACPVGDVSPVGRINRAIFASIEASAMAQDGIEKVVKWRPMMGTTITQWKIAFPTEGDIESKVNKLMEDENARLVKAMAGAKHKSGIIAVDVVNEVGNPDHGETFAITIGY